MFFFNSLNQSLVANNNQNFRFGYDSTSQKYGYILKEADTDVFVPFKSSFESVASISGIGANATYTFSANYDFVLFEYHSSPQYGGYVSTFTLSEGKAITVYNGMTWRDGYSNRDQQHWLYILLDVKVGDKITHSEGGNYGSGGNIYGLR